jgi:MFS-type transporter involved in bile tolerance (Atg22 family)
MSLIHNEQTKLTATLINTVASAVFVVGVVAPLVALSYDLPGPRGTTIVASFFWIVCGGGIHLLARRLLRGMRE